jgi:very-short-patch-repair endonuclease
VEISGAGRIHRAPAGVVVHERCVLLPGDTGRIDCIAVTSGARTLIDLAQSLDPNRLERALESAIRLGLITPEYLMRRMKRVGTQGRRCIKNLVQILVQRGDAPPSDSDFEIELLQVLRNGRLPLPERQVEIHDEEGFIARADFVYELAKLIIEADSFKYHGTKNGWENDNRKRARLIALGYRILPVTWRMLHEQPEVVENLVRRSLSAKTP